MKKTVKRAISVLLLVLMLTSMFSISALADGECFRPYTGKSYSIVDALHAVGADYSYAYRKQIAAANNIQGYRGTAQQNLQMLELLKAGKLVQPAAEASSGEALPGCYPAYKGKVTGLVQALNAVGAPIAFAHRAKIALANADQAEALKGIKKVEDYKGTYAQNAALLDLLVKGQLRKIEL